MYISGPFLASVHWPVLCCQKWLYLLQHILKDGVPAVLPRTKEKTKKNFHPLSVFFSCAMLFLNCESMDWIVDICFAGAMSRLQMCFWKSFICAGSAATFLGVGNTSNL